jgi:dCTP deaminase
MFLADVDIIKAIAEKRVVIDPYEPEYVGGNTIDLTLHTNFRVFHNTAVTHIDVKQPFDVTELVQVNPEDQSFIIHPGEFVLGSTREQIGLPNDLCGILEGRSSLGRLGLIVHATASMVKPGWYGYLTLEMTNISKLPIKLYAGMRIAQLALVQLTHSVSHLYSKTDKYHTQTAPTASRIWEDFQPKQK